MSTGAILAGAEIIRMLLRGYMEAVRQSNMTEEEKEARFKEMSETFDEFSPDKLTPSP